MSLAILPNELILMFSKFLAPPDLSSLILGSNHHIAYLLTSEHFRTEGPWKSIIWACENENKLAASLLINHFNVSPNITDDRGLAPLHHAAWKRKPEMVAFLLARGADYNLRTNSLTDEMRKGVGLHPQFEGLGFNMKAVHFAALVDCKESIRLLHEDGASLRSVFELVPGPSSELEAKDTFSSLYECSTNALAPVHIAAHNNSVEALEYVLDNVAGNELEREDRAENSPLNWAVSNDSSDAVRSLLKRGANVNHPGEEGISLHTAGWNMHVKALKVLLEFKQQIEGRGMVWDVIHDLNRNCKPCQRVTATIRLLEAFWGPGVVIGEDEYADGKFSDD